MTYIFANWKMYLSSAETKTLAVALANGTISADMTVAVFPNTLDFQTVTNVLEDSPVQLGAQNVSWVQQGAYTGATSAYLFAESGATYALVGHSERRYIFGEDDDAVRQKVEACLDAGITPVICIGETQEDIDAGKKEYRIKKQIMKSFDGLNLSKDAQVLVAYEPVWAISQGGDGVPCDPELAHETHTMIKEEIKNYTDKEVPVLYGGSVTPENMVSFTMYPSVDGVLVGSAETSAEGMNALIERGAQQ